MKTIYFSLGSNLGDRISILEQTIQKINTRIGEVTKISSVYETKALGFESEELFYNCCIGISTKLTLLEVLHLTQSIEKESGRIKTKIGEYESRIIDIDIILSGVEVLKTTKLSIPHILFRERNFVLHPLEEISPHSIDPISGLTIQQLKKNSSDDSEIKRLNYSIIHVF